MLRLRKKILGRMYVIENEYVCLNHTDLYKSFLIELIKLCRMVAYGLVKINSICAFVSTSTFQAVYLLGKNRHAAMQFQCYD